jgi:hypothetical protein
MTLAFRSGSTGSGRIETPGSAGTVGTARFFLPADDRFLDDTTGENAEPGAPKESPILIFSTVPGIQPFS